MNNLNTCKIHPLMIKSYSLCLLESFGNMLALGLLVLWAPFIYAQSYVPGTPGAPWSDNEIIIIKSKLYSIFDRNGGHNALKQIYGKKSNAPFKWTWSDVPNAPKMLRLGFHDCLR